MKNALLHDISLWSLKIFYTNYLIFSMKIELKEKVLYAFAPFY